MEERSILERVERGTHSKAAVDVAVYVVNDF